ncbi:SRPBCC family protein [Streptomyces sp. NPDC005803]|uniref:SRPBCC family protein n=1 Tax=Streptomyces sp. NPDC005803 TaxID=3154297 RepID=UPI003402F461
MFDRFEFEKFRYRWHKTVILPCNWKTAPGASNEGYHVQTTHPQLHEDHYQDDAPGGGASDSTTTRAEARSCPGRQREDTSETGWDVVTDLVVVGSGGGSCAPLWPPMRAGCKPW